MNRFREWLLRQNDRSFVGERKYYPYLYYWVYRVSRIENEYPKSIKLSEILEYVEKSFGFSEKIARECFKIENDRVVEIYVRSEFLRSLRDSKIVVMNDRENEDDMSIDSLENLCERMGKINHCDEIKLYVTLPFLNGLIKCGDVELESLTEETRKLLEWWKEKYDKEKN